MPESSRQCRPPIERFQAKWAEDAKGCWIWTAALKANGYGVFGPGASRRNTYAHRWAYDHFVGPIPHGMMVCHHCDVRALVAKGRSLRGERHNLVKLTESQVREIRRLWAAGDIMQPELAQRFDTTKGTVSLIVRGETWRHILPADWVPPAPRKWSRP